MPVRFSDLTVGQTYSRHQFAKLWGYQGYQALARGVVTPRHDHFIILFVTKEKQDSFEQYQDDLSNDILHWEGPTDHFAEPRMLDAEQNGDEIHVFYRTIHHTDFIYEGQFKIVSCQQSTTQPSKFILHRAHV